MLTVQDARESDPGPQILKIFDYFKMSIDFQGFAEAGTFTGEISE